MNVILSIDTFVFLFVRILVKSKWKNRIRKRTPTEVWFSAAFCLGLRAKWTFFSPVAFLFLLFHLFPEEVQTNKGTDVSINSISFLIFGWFYFNMTTTNFGQRQSCHCQKKTKEKKRKKIVSREKSRENHLVDVIFHVDVIIPPVACYCWF